MATAWAENTLWVEEKFDAVVLVRLNLAKEATGTLEDILEDLIAESCGVEDRELVKFFLTRCKGDESFKVLWLFDNWDQSRISFDRSKCKKLGLRWVIVSLEMEDNLDSSDEFFKIFVERLSDSLVQKFVASVFREESDRRKMERLVNSDALTEICRDDPLVLSLVCFLGPVYCPASSDSINSTMLLNRVTATMLQRHCSMGEREIFELESVFQGIAFFLTKDRNNHVFANDFDENSKIPLNMVSSRIFKMIGETRELVFFSSVLRDYFAAIYVNKRFDCFDVATKLASIDASDTFVQFLCQLGGKLVSSFALVKIWFPYASVNLEEALALAIQKGLDGVVKTLLGVIGPTESVDFSDLFMLAATSVQGGVLRLLTEARVEEAEELFDEPLWEGLFQNREVAIARVCVSSCLHIASFNCTKFVLKILNAFVVSRQKQNVFPVFELEALKDVFCDVSDDLLMASLDVAHRNMILVLSDNCVCDNLDWFNEAKGLLEGGALSFPSFTENDSVMKKLYKLKGLFESKFLSRFGLLAFLEIMSEWNAKVENLWQIAHDRVDGVYFGVCPGGNADLDMPFILFLRSQTVSDCIFIRINGKGWDAVGESIPTVP
jgi:hypothetical protein